MFQQSFKVIVIFVISLTVLACATGSDINLTTEHKPLKVHALFGDHMVLQRNKAIKIFGSAQQGSVVSVTFAKKTLRVTTNADQQWLATFPAMPTGGVHQVTISNLDDTVTFNDILIGDVWIASGQSNMKFTLRKTKDNLTSFNFNNIRMFTVTGQAELTPRKDLIVREKHKKEHHQEWLVATSDKIKHSTAVGYYFAQEVHLKTGIPIGIIGASWGGTGAEAWTSAEAMSNFPRYQEDIKFSKTSEYTFDYLRSDFNQWQSSLVNEGIGLEEKWFLPSTNSDSWLDYQVPDLFKNQSKELVSWNGAVWFRTTFDLPKAWLNKNLKLYLGQVDDHDKTWVNGEYLGETFANYRHSSYRIKKANLKEKGNVLVVRLFDMSEEGGFKTSPKSLGISLAKGKSTKQILSGTWQYKKGTGKNVNFSYSKAPKFTSSGTSPNSYVSTLYNGMISPLIQYPIKGVVWYQGENNASRAYDYRTIFPNLITDWRKQWQQAEFPFYFVQLANFLKRETAPNNPKHTWPALREAQTMTLSLPNTGMAVAIDIGEAKDIHPKNKRDVGIRLARNALHQTYHQDIVPHGPLYQSHEIRKNEIVITFSGLGSGLLSKSGSQLKGFTIAGDDKVFYWADAKIANNKVVVSHANITNPVSVRYGWANNPDVSLYNKEGLPVSPFRTDDWRLIADNSAK